MNQGRQGLLKHEGRADNETRAIDMRKWNERDERKKRQNFKMKQET